METTHDSETEILRNAKLVIVDHGRRLGRMWAMAGASCGPEDVLSKKSQLGGDQVTELYLRTNDLNIYRLDRYGRVVDHEESNQATDMIYHQLTDAQIAELAAQRIVVGQSFVWGERATAPIIEMVAVTSRQYTRERLEGLAGSRSSTIVDEFRASLPEEVVMEDEFLGSVYEGAIPA